MTRLNMPKEGESKFTAVSKHHAQEVQLVLSAFGYS